MGKRYVPSMGCISCGRRTTAGRLRCRACQEIYDMGYHKGNNEHDIALLERAARSLGMTYGRAVGLYGDHEMLIRAGMLPDMIVPPRREA